MPAALQGVDWEAIRHDRVENNLSFEQLEAKHGVKWQTIAQRAKRHGWKGTAQIAKAAARHAVKHAANAHVASAIAALKPEMERAAQEWIENARTTARKVVEQVSSRLDASQEPEDLVKLANALDRADTVGRRALRLDTPEATNAGRPLVSMHFGEGSLSIVLGDAQAPMDSGPVIDVDSSDNQGPETT